MKDNYYKQVSDILIKRDPLKLIAMGAPENEYDIEVGEIVSETNKENMTYPEIEKVIMSVFERKFDKETVEGSREHLKFVAEDISKLNKDESKTK